MDKVLQAWAYFKFQGELKCCKKILIQNNQRNLHMLASSMKKWSEKYSSILKKSKMGFFVLLKPTIKNLLLIFLILKFSDHLKHQENLIINFSTLNTHELSIFCKFFSFNESLIHDNLTRQNLWKRTRYRRLRLFFIKLCRIKPQKKFGVVIKNLA